MKPHQDSFPKLSRILFISFLLLTSLLQTSLAQDSLGVRCVGKLQNYEMWDNATGVVVSGNRGYVATGLTGLRIVDIQNPDQPVEIGHFVTGQSIRDVVLVGNLAFLANYEQGIKIVDVSNPSSPLQVGSLDLTNTKKIIIEGNLGFAVCGQGISAFTFDPPSNPIIMSTYSPTGSAYEFDISNSRAYIFSSWYGGSLGSGYRFYYQFSVVSFLSPNNPRLLNSSTREHFRYNGIKVLGNTAFIFDNTGIKTYGIDDSLHFNLLGTYDRNPIMPTSFLFCDSMLYIGNLFNNRTSICTFNVTNPSHIQLVSTIDCQDFTIEGIAMNNHRLFVANATRGLKVFDFTNIYQPIATGLCGSQFYSYDVSVRSHTAFIASHFDGFRAVDVSNPARIVDTVRIPLQYPAWGITISDSLAFLGNYYGLRIIDVENTLNPISRGFCTTPGGVATNTFVRNNLAYVAVNAGGLQILDYHNPDSIMRIGAIQVSGGAIDVAVLNEIAFVTSNSGLHIINVSNPTSPILISTFAAGSCSSIKIRNNLAYITGYDAGLKIVDITNPDILRLLGTCSNCGWAYRLSLRNDYAFVAAGGDGLKVVDISNPSQPTVVGFYNTLGSANGVDSDSNYVYIADSNNLLVMDCSVATNNVKLVNDLTPCDYQLMNNYPNPFNSTTEIRYAIAKTSKVDLRVFDVTGREVAKLVDFHQNPGEYTFHFDGKALSAGTYFVRLQAGGFMQTKKMILLK